MALLKNCLCQSEFVSLRYVTPLCAVIGGNRITPAPQQHSGLGGHRETHVNCLEFVFDNIMSRSIYCLFDGYCFTKFILHLWIWTCFKGSLCMHGSVKDIIYRPNYCQSDGFCLYLSCFLHLWTWPRQKNTSYLLVFIDVSFQHFYIKPCNYSCSTFLYGLAAVWN